ncbi:MAG: KamA family radical SAM protein [Myxococcaceae bacterium]|nr:KamA family radical SAM protein [Myxococcaceae bacterium]MBH2005813.1 KamA family radical SAM protein [Myxococcaceae bacterium]
MSRSWQEELRRSPKSIEDLERFLVLTDSERSALLQLSLKGGLPFQVTEHFLKQINPNDPNDPLRQQIVPRETEFIPFDLERRDPLGEEDHEAVPHLIHRYPDRVLLLVTDRCASYCRFCTRKRWVGQGPTPNLEDFQNALTYIRSNPAIKEVIFSGGDALLLSDRRLLELIRAVRSIPSVEIIRLATRMLAFAPQRIEDSLLQELKAYQPIYFLTHFNHVNELPLETQEAILRLVDNGFPVLNQTVLLKDINDSFQALSELFRKLTYLRARPYYLHQCDLAPGTESFRVPFQRALELLEQLRGHISGLCLPTFVIDVPGGFGKVPIVPNSIVETLPDRIRLKGFRGNEADYPSR